MVLFVFLVGATNEFVVVLFAVSIVATILVEVVAGVFKAEAVAAGND